jgi:hypothetical protein
MIIKLRLVTLEEILSPYAAVVAHTAENAATFVEHDRGYQVRLRYLRPLLGCGRICTIKISL